MKQVFALFFAIVAFCCSAQVGPNLYFLQFTDKQGSQFTLDQPSAFLSERAIQRRNNQNISIDSLDLPVSSIYLAEIQNLGLEIYNVTKWLNGVTVRTEDENLIAQAYTLPFVKDSSFIDQLPINQDSISAERNLPIKEQANHLGIKTDFTDYGYSWEQISLHNGHKLHAEGYKGEGMIIAIIDGGFAFADSMASLEHLHNTGKIIDTHDFAHSTNDVYAYDAHGSMVLSVMAGHVPGEFIGNAVEANFMLLVSENVYYEEIVEELNLISALEYADSAGADLANISLGYVDFDNSRYNHAAEDMNGQTCPSSLAAKIAAEKGMVVVVAAGNSGLYENRHTWIGAPADASKALCVGAVNVSEDYAAFSSHGRITNESIKPDFVSVGWNTFIDYPNDSIATGNGTSFACPNMTGLICCFWQKFHSLSADQVRTTLQNATRNTNPSNPNDTTFYTGTPNIFTGRGIVDFDIASEIFTKKMKFTANKPNVTIFPNPTKNKITIKVEDEKHFDINIFSTQGQLLSYYNNCINNTEIDLRHFAKGEYIITFTIDNQVVDVQKIIKH